ncbi:hypothetical protein B0H12DRAFT_1198091 [Mycena haematopus]|nr:hypothetical protein B0H12DRAFT_1198091 [Mycena haematopus]
MNGLWWRNGTHPRRSTQKSAAMQFFDLRMGPHEALFSQMPARDLVRLMQTCRRIHFLVKEVCFNLTRLLGRFFGASGVDQFRQMQRLTGTIISGSIALQFFNRLTWHNSDLDIYVSRASAAFAALFIVDNGYTFKPRKSQDKNIAVQLDASVADRAPSYLGRGIADVLDFYKGTNQVQLIVATTAPMEIILSFHSTCVMNFITYENAFSLYPWSTFVGKEALVVETVGAGQEIGRQKYADRGWEMIRSPSASYKSELGIRVGRSVGDLFTWSISLPLLGHGDTVERDSTDSYKWQLECDGETVFTTLSPSTTTCTIAR